MRYTITAFAQEVNLPPESVRYACNRVGLKIADDDSFQYPENIRQRERFFMTLATRPLNAAERLRADLGCRLPRAMPE